MPETADTAEWNIQVLAIGAEIIGYHLISDIIPTFLGARFSEVQFAEGIGH